MRADCLAAKSVATGLLIAAGGICAALAASASAQCSVTDQQIRAQYSKASLVALMSGDRDRYQALERQLPRELSPGCRGALAELEPVRTRCTPAEKATVMNRYELAMQAALRVDAMQMFGQMEQMERDVSPACWLAVNRHTDPGVQSACSTAELDHLASMASPVLRAAKRAIVANDMGPRLQASQAAAAPLSQACFQALMRLQQQRQPPPAPGRAARPQMPGNVIDLGGGNYSVPGVGACTSSGCVAF